MKDLSRSEVGARESSTLGVDEDDLTLANAAELFFGTDEQVPSGKEDSPVACTFDTAGIGDAVADNRWPQLRFILELETALDRPNQEVRGERSYS